MHPPREKIDRFLTLAVCLAWVAAFAYLLVGGRYLFFLARGYWVLLAFGAAAFAAFGVAVAAGAVPASHGGARRGYTVSLAVCLLPLVYLAANPRPLPSSYTLAIRAKFERLWRSQAALGLANLSPLGARGRVGAGAQAGTMPASAPADSKASPVLPATVLELFLDFPDDVGRRVEVEGMVARQQHLPAGSMVLFRFVITCCAADAMPAAVLVFTPRAETFAADSWVRVRARVERMEYQGIDMPVLRAETVAPIGVPANPYIN